MKNTQIDIRSRLKVKQELQILLDDDVLNEDLFFEVL